MVDLASGRPKRIDSAIRGLFAGHWPKTVGEA